MSIDPRHVSTRDADIKANMFRYYELASPISISYHHYLRHHNEYCL